MKGIMMFTKKEKELILRVLDGFLSCEISKKDSKLGKQITKKITSKENDQDKQVSKVLYCPLRGGNCLENECKLHNKSTRKCELGKA